MIHSLKYITALAMLFIAAAANAQAWALVNLDTMTVIASHNAEETRSVASITKVMTAIVALDHDSDLDRTIRVSNTYLGSGIRTRGALLKSLLIRSDNRAAEALAADYPGGRAAFIQQMNQRASELGMTNTEFADPSGLSSQNRSTISDILLLLSESRSYPDITRISVKTQDSVRAGRNTVQLFNTNRQLLSMLSDVVVSKTGFTSAAGYCVAMVLDQLGGNVAVVVMGAKSRQQRTEIARNLIANQSVTTAWIGR
jgi:serine-type D-Ala-D-Ala endopeptidase (penicillin-binding protein 7)